MLTSVYWCPPEEKSAMRRCREGIAQCVDAHGFEPQEVVVSHTDAAEIRPWVTFRVRASVKVSTGIMVFYDHLTGAGPWPQGDRQ